MIFIVLYYIFIINVFNCINVFKCILCKCTNVFENTQ